MLCPRHIKRVDPETGWIYFGRRFYDPSNGRWTTTDPLGFADGPNLYAYLHHSPLSAFDAYGFVGEAYRDGCNVATNPNYFDGISNEYSPCFWR
ncbi:RHS repeat-associated core domain-containing protein [Candidatus Protochlamydia naegleriophila]|uniref:RHS repeat-associated core domain-containing protein n=1 Tax=Candidatus Protochlamydia naegleriophila TaxID=389348 RepID=UPI0009AD0392